MNEPRPIGSTFVRKSAPNPPLKGYAQTTAPWVFEAVTYRVIGHAYMLRDGSVTLERPADASQIAYSGERVEPISIEKTPATLCIDPYDQMWFEPRAADSLVVVRFVDKTP